MKYHRLNVSLLLVAMVCVAGACATDGTGSHLVDDPGYSITGTVIQGSAPVGGAAVNLDGAADPSATTDQAGQFTVSGVSAGLHHVMIRGEDASGSFAEKQFDVYVSSRTNAGEVKLPAPVTLFPIVATAQTLALTWTRSGERDFQEYRVYRGHTPGLDETTGTLMRVATGASDTTFLDRDLPAASKYFYRLFLMNDRGRFGGSNIQSATTASVPPVENGGFEEVSDVDGWPFQWDKPAATTPPDIVHLYPDSTTAYEGKRSLKFELADNDVNYAFWAQTHVNAALLAPGGTYRLSARARTDRIVPARFDVELEFGNPYTVVWVRANESQIGVNSWYLVQTTEFTMPADLTNTTLLLEVVDLSPGPLGVWFDDVRLVRIR